MAPDLPGHGFTSMPTAGRLSLPGMAEALGALVRALGMPPDYAAGHSAGAAVLVRMALDGRIAPGALVGLNAALLPIGREHSEFFSRAAKLLAGLPFVPQVFAWGASNRAVAERLLRDTGSAIEPRGVELYARLFRHSGHLAAALGMMANWDLKPLLRDLPRLRPPLTLAVGTRDRTIPPVGRAAGQGGAAQRPRRVPAGPRATSRTRSGRSRWRRSCGGSRRRRRRRPPPPPDGVPRRERASHGGATPGGRPRHGRGTRQRTAARRRCRATIRSGRR